MYIVFKRSEISEENRENNKICSLPLILTPIYKGMFIPQVL